MSIEVTSTFNKVADEFMRQKADKIKLVMAKNADDHLELITAFVTGTAYGVIRGKDGKQKWARGAMTNDGRLPVPQRTGNLSRSPTIRKINDFEYYIYINTAHLKKSKSGTSYATFVHDGTKRMQPRPFATRAMEQRKAEYARNLKQALR